MLRRPRSCRARNMGLISSGFWAIAVLTAVRMLLADIYGQQEPGSNMDITSFISYVELTDWQRRNSTKEALVTLTVGALGLARSASFSCDIAKERA
jgi:hypothetical protein